jgi:hypothetical protein
MGCISVVSSKGRKEIHTLAAVILSTGRAESRRFGKEGKTYVYD